MYRPASLFIEVLYVQVENVSVLWRKFRGTGGGGRHAETYCTNYIGGIREMGQTLFKDMKQLLIKCWIKTPCRVQRQVDYLSECTQSCTVYTMYTVPWPVNCTVFDTIMISLHRCHASFRWAPTTMIIYFRFRYSLEHVIETKVTII